MSARLNLMETLVGDGAPSSAVGLNLNVPGDAARSSSGGLAQRRAEDVQADAYFKRLMRGPLGAPVVKSFDEERSETVVAGWRVVRVAGRGGMSTVYEVESTQGSAQRRGALKLASYSRCGRPAAQLIHEIETLVALQNGPVAHPIETGVHDDGRPFVVLEFIDGLPVTAFAWDLPVRARLETFVHVCEAVAHVHESGFVHCDLKPSNILVAPGGRVTLIDFGIASRAGQVAAGQAGLDPVLTPEFASPEQMLRADITRASDVYTLGLLMHELLCGRRQRLPWSLSGGCDSSMVFCPTRVVFGEWGIRPAAETASARAFAALTSERPAAAPFALDSEIERVLRKALQPDPDSRYLDASAFADEVQRLLTSPETGVPSPSKDSVSRTPELCESN